LKIFLYFLVLLFYSELYSYNSYHDSTLCCVITEVKLNLSLDDAIIQNAHIYKAYTGYDTIMLISKKKCITDTNGLVSIQKGHKYKLILRFIPLWIDFVNSNICPYKRSHDSLTLTMFLCTDNRINFVTYKDLYYELDFLRKCYPSDKSFFLFYTSDDIIDEYVPDSLLVRDLSP